MEPPRKDRGGPRFNFDMQTRRGEDLVPDDTQQLLPQPIQARRFAAFQPCRNGSSSTPRFRHLLKCQQTRLANFRSMPGKSGQRATSFPVWAPFSVHLEPPLARIAAAAAAPPELHIMPRILRINTSSFYG
jgi:hypothetical protein